MYLYDEHDKVDLNKWTGEKKKINLHLIVIMHLLMEHISSPNMTVMVVDILDVLPGTSSPITLEWY